MIKRQNSDNLSDKELLDQFRLTGESAWLGKVYHRYMHLIYGVCLKYLKNNELAKDAVMDIFEHLVTRVKDQEIQDFGKWVYVVARNHCLMQLRKKEFRVNHEEVPQIFMEFEQEMHLNYEEDIENRLEQLKDGLDSLPEEQEKCVRLFYYEEKSYMEIARDTGYDLKKVKSYIQNGKRNLKIWIEKKSGN